MQSLPGSRITQAEPMMFACGTRRTLHLTLSLYAYYANKTTPPPKRPLTLGALGAWHLLFKACRLKFETSTQWSFGSVLGERANPTSRTEKQCLLSWSLGPDFVSPPCPHSCAAVLRHVCTCSGSDLGRLQVQVLARNTSHSRAITCLPASQTKAACSGSST